MPVQFDLNSDYMKNNLLPEWVYLLMGGIALLGFTVLAAWLIKYT